MRSDVFERCEFCAHPKSRPHACEAQNQAHLGWTDYVNRVPRCAIPFAFRTWTAQNARSHRDLESLPRKLGLKPSVVRSPCRAAMLQP